MASAYSLRIGQSNGRGLHRRHGSTRRGAVATSDKKSAIGWDSHKAVKAIPESLVKEIDGNESMRAKFEHLCRTSQVRLSQGLVLQPQLIECIITGRHL